MVSANAHSADRGYPLLKGGGKDFDSQCDPICPMMSAARLAESQSKGGMSEGGRWEGQGSARGRSPLAMKQGSAKGRNPLAKKQGSAMGRSSFAGTLLMAAPSQPPPSERRSPSRFLDDHRTLECDFLWI